MNLQEKQERLQDILKDMKSVVIGFSGGVDSSLLTYMAYSVLGDKAMAVTAVSPTLPKREEDDARRIAREIGIAHLVVPSTEFENVEFVKNPINRCYICKKIRFTALVEFAREHGFLWVADGGNLDDLGDYRPGMKALQELSDFVRSPMIEAGITKADIRALSRQFNLSVWNKQSAACLASRIPYGTDLTAERLSQVEKAEAFLTTFVQGSLRVRYHHDIARIEVGEADIDAVAARRREVVRVLRECGFRHVTLDLAGYEMGSLNDVSITGAIKKES